MRKNTLLCTVIIFLLSIIYERDKIDVAYRE